MTTYKLQSHSDKTSLTESAANIIVDIIVNTLKEKQNCKVALSGGTTPSNVYKLLSTKDIDWQRVDVFLGDERWVDSNDPLSNSLMIKNTLLSNYPGSKANFYSIPTTSFPNPKLSAEAFEKKLQENFSEKPPQFDLVLLGLGEDGHTASLFPNSNSLKVFDRLCTVSEGNGQSRITLTSPVLSSGKNVIFLVSGSSKQVAIKRLIDPNESSNRTPAKLVQPSSEIIVLADEPSLALI